MATHPAPPPNWWSRNWKWFVPVLAVTGLALFAGFIALLLGFVFGMMKSSEPYQAAVARAHAHPEVAAALGEPITTGYFVQGNLSTNGPSGEADLAIPLRGPRGQATLYVEAEQSAGEWEYRTLVVKIDDSGQRIDLRAETPDAEIP